MKRLTILQNTPLLAVLLCAVAVGFWLVASRFSGTQVELSSLDQLHLITSLAYLLLLSGVSGLRIAVAARRSVPVTILPDSLVVLLGYILPGLIGLLPVLIDAGVYWYQPRMLWEMFTAPSLVWAPVTQALALSILHAQTGPGTFDNKRTSRSLPWQGAVLAGVGLLLVCVFAYQMSEVALARTLQPSPPVLLHLILAFAAAVLMPLYSEPFLRGRLLHQPVFTGRSLPYAALCALLTMRPLLFLPAGFCAFVFARLTIFEGRLRSARLAHLAFNLAALFLNIQLIH